MKESCLEEDNFSSLGDAVATDNVAKQTAIPGIDSCKYQGSGIAISASYKSNLTKAR